MRTVGGTPLDRLDPAVASAAWSPSPDDPWDVKWAGHLLGRAGFGASYADLASATAAGPEAAVDGLLAGGHGRAEFDRLMDELAPVTGRIRFAVVSVKGWSGGESWVNSATLLARNDLAWKLVRGGPAVPGFRLNPAALVRNHSARRDADVRVDFLLQPGEDGVDFDPSARRKLAGYLAAGGDCHDRLRETTPAARPILRLTRARVVRVDDHVGLNPGLRELGKLLSDGRLAIVQGVGYTNPDRSHFESMDVRQTPDPVRRTGSGWLGRSLGSVRVRPVKIPGVRVGTQQLPLALRGSATGVPMLHASRPYDLDLPGGPGGELARPADRMTPAAGRTRSPRRNLIEELAEAAPARDDLRRFVRRTSLQTYASIEKLRKVSDPLRASSRRTSPIGAGFGGGRDGLGQNLTLVANMIAAGFGTRVFYVSIGGFDTHADQLGSHQQALQELGDSVASFFARLETTGHAGRVVLVTFSEFGRRVHENGSPGTDHGAASCLFLAGAAVKGGGVGTHPGLAAERLDAGDLKHHTDFRRVYATLLDEWLGCDSREVLGARFDPLTLLRAPS